MDYLNFFNLKEDPFLLTPDSSYFYPSRMHNDVLASLDYAVEQKEGFSLVVGEPGTGKTTILKIFVNRWKEKAEIALIITPRLSPEELIQAILEDLKINIKTNNKNKMLKAFRDFLIERSVEGKRVIIIVDEAQNLSDASLEELRLLSNLETEKQKLIQIILVGQPELQKRLQSEGLRQLNQRITIRADLRPLSEQETSDYISFRLVKAGKGSAIVDDKAKKMIHKITGGVPRLVNLITSRAMMVAYINSAHDIQNKHVLDAEKHLSLRESSTFNWRLIGYATAAMIVILLIPLTLLMYYNMKNQQIKSPETMVTAAIVEKKHINKTVADENPAALPTYLKSLRKATVAVPTARLREQPSLQANTARLVARGESFEIIGDLTELSGEKWFKVRAPGGKELWIAAHIVSESSP